MSLAATSIQIHPATTGQLIAQGPATQSLGDTMQVKVAQSIGSGFVRLGNSAVNASEGFQWASSNLPFSLDLNAGESLYAAAVPTTMLTVLRTRT